MISIFSCIDMNKGELLMGKAQVSFSIHWMGGDITFTTVKDLEDKDLKLELKRQLTHLDKQLKIEAVRQYLKNNISNEQLKRIKIDISSKREPFLTE
jgi:CRISPR/Cas system-associated protein Cas10 (large subunit of type III CRISPR-Cas system)